MIWLKRLGYLVGGLVVLLLLALLTAYIVTALRFRKRYEVAATPIVVGSDSSTLARGRHLAVAIGKCVSCHATDLGGELMFDNGAFGRLAAPNLTSGKGGVFARYVDSTLARAIRRGIRANGTPLFFMPSEAYQGMSDQDVAALIAYLHSLPPVDREHPAPRIGPMARVLYLVMGFPLLPARLIDHAAVPPAMVAESANKEYGKYLVDLGGCSGCHNPSLSGGKLGPDEKPASNLTPAGIGNWTEADFTRALREGIRPGGTPIDTLMPWKLAGQMTDAEIHAIWLYLRSVPPKPFGEK